MIIFGTSWCSLFVDGRRPTQGGSRTLRFLVTNARNGIFIVCDSNVRISDILLVHVEIRLPSCIQELSTYISISSTELAANRVNRTLMMKDSSSCTKHAGLAFIHTTPDFLFWYFVCGDPAITGMSLKIWTLAVLPLLLVLFLTFVCFANWFTVRFAAKHYYVTWFDEPALEDPQVLAPTGATPEAQNWAGADQADLNNPDQQPVAGGPEAGSGAAAGSHHGTEGTSSQSRGANVSARQGTLLLSTKYSQVAPRGKQPGVQQAAVSASPAASAPAPSNAPFRFPTLPQIPAQQKQPGAVGGATGPPVGQPGKPGPWPPPVFPSQLQTVETVESAAE